MSRREPHSLQRSAFYRLKSPHKLAELLRIKREALQALSASHDNLYSEFEIDKKAGGKRRVESPRNDLKIVQARIAQLLGRIRPPDHLFCPVKRRSYVTNAAQHRHNRVVRCLDVKKYFPSTRRPRVYWFFHTVMGCSPDVAGILANLATYRGYLPTGSPLSPIMSYYAHIDVWDAIACIARQNGLTLTVYVDDVTVSGTHVPDRLMWEIKRVVHRSGLRYHKEKAYIDRPAEITGVIVRDGTLRVPNRQLLKVRRLRENLRSCARDGLEAERLAGQLSGLEAQITQIEAAGL